MTFGLSVTRASTQTERRHVVTDSGSYFACGGGVHLQANLQIAAAPPGGEREGSRHWSLTSSVEYRPSYRQRVAVWLFAVTILSVKHCGYACSRYLVCADDCVVAVAAQQEGLQCSRTKTTTDPWKSSSSGWLRFTLRSFHSIK